MAKQRIRNLLQAFPKDGRFRMADVDADSTPGLKNRKRFFVADGVPVVTGFAAVADASVCTNPLYGRGCSLALVHAYALADALDAHPNDGVELALEFAAATTRELDPWFGAAVQQDREAIEAARRSRAPEKAVPAGPLAPENTNDSEGYVDPAAWARDVFREGLMPAVRTSPEVFRAFLRWFNLLATPDSLMNDPGVIGAALATYQDRAARPAEPALGPKRRRDLLAAL